MKRNSFCKKHDSAKLTFTWVSANESFRIG